MTSLTLGQLNIPVSWLAFLFAIFYCDFRSRRSDSTTNKILELSGISFEDYAQFIQQTIQNVHQITVPVAVYYGQKDDTLYEESARFIYENVSSSVKKKSGFLHSTHLLTLGEEKELLFEEVLSFMKNTESSTLYK